MLESRASETDILHRRSDKEDWREKMAEVGSLTAARMASAGAAERATEPSHLSAPFPGGFQ